MAEAAVNPVSRPGDEFVSTDSSLPQYIYEEKSGLFWMKDPNGKWIFLPKSLFDLHLKDSGLKSFADGAPLSEVDQMIRKISVESRVFYAGPLAGYREGVYRFEGESALVTRSPELIDPVAGDWPVLGGFLSNLLQFRDPETECFVDQSPWFFGWLKHTLECLYSGTPQRGLALVLAGEVECGKSLLVDIIKVMMGGRAAYPYQYMIGNDNFNQDLFESPLLIVDDENADTSIKARLNFGAKIKQFVAKSAERCRGLHQKAITLSPLWRLVICVNLEPDRLMVLPPIDDDIFDKMMLIKAYKKPMPMPVGTIAEKKEFWDTMMKELPAFIEYVLDFPVSQKMQGRFGVKHFHHPDILDCLHEVSPEAKLYDLIDRTVLAWGQEWIGTTQELRRDMLSDDAKLNAQDKNLVPEQSWMGRRLAKLAHKYPKQFMKKQTAKQNVWTIRRDGYEPEAEESGSIL